MMRLAAKRVFVAAPGDGVLMLYVREDRETAELVVQALRIHHAAWRADTHEYRLTPA